MRYIAQYDTCCASGAARTPCNTLPEEVAVLMIDRVDFAPPRNFHVLPLVKPCDLIARKIN